MSWEERNPRSGAGSGSGCGAGSGFAVGCAVMRAGGLVPCHLSRITYHVPEAGAEAEAESGGGDSSIDPGPRPETETGMREPR